MTGAGTYALLTDGSTVEIRDPVAADADAVRDMHAAMSPENMYLRFFSLSPLSADREAVRICREPDSRIMRRCWPGWASQLVGVASYEATGQPGIAEIAFAVPDDMHGRGIATLLLEHLVSLARQRGLHGVHRRDAARQQADAAGLRRRRAARAAAPGRRRGGADLPAAVRRRRRRLDGYLDRWPPARAAPTWPACGTCCSLSRWP